MYTRDLYAITWQPWQDAIGQIWLRLRDAKRCGEGDDGDEERDQHALFVDCRVYWYMIQTRSTGESNNCVKD